MSPKRRADFPDVATIYDYARSPDDLPVFDLIFNSQGLSRSYMTPPDTPPARLEALRGAMAATLADPAFRADASAANLDIAASGGADVARLVDRFYATPPAAVARANKAVGH